MLHAVIMAGGTGTRFWPESRARRPKQFMRMLGRKTMIRATVDRLGGLVPPERIVIATTAELAQMVAEELPELPPQAVLAEPMKRNTAPSIGLAALYVTRDDPEPTMAVMPSDHVISPDAAFHRAVQMAAALVEQDPERIVTFGIRPTYPAESFGYIERGRPIDAGQPKEGRPPAYEVEQFREKPDAETARHYVESGTFYWNSGIFVWKARTVLDALARYEPQLHAGLRRIAGAQGSPEYDEVLKREFEGFNPISIDYAVMERAKAVAVVEAPFDWDDAGSWQAVARLHGTDAEGNTIDAKHLGLDTTGTIVRGGDEHLIVTLGLSDCIVVHTPDATLVANKHDEESVRKVVEMLQQRGWTEYL